MALLDSPDPDDVVPVLIWWGCLSAVAALNCGVLLRSARSSLSSNRHCLPPWLRSIRDRQYAMSSTYVYGCAYRSILPCHHTLRRVLVRSIASTGLVGRAVATIAELGVAEQASLLLREIGIATDDGTTIATSRVIVPILLVAEISSWYACATTNYVGSIVEEGLWATCAMLVLSCLARCRREYEVGGEQWHFVRRALTINSAYFAYMISIDVPNYVRAHLANTARGVSYHSVSDGLGSLLRIDEHDLTWSCEDWRYSMCWMTLYFSVACWASIWMVNAPRMDEGLVRSKLSVTAGAEAGATAALSTMKKKM